MFLSVLSTTSCQYFFNSERADGADVNQLLFHDGHLVSTLGAAHVFVGLLYFHAKVFPFLGGSGEGTTILGKPIYRLLDLFGAVVVHVAKHIEGRRLLCQVELVIQLGDSLVRFLDGIYIAGSQLLLVFFDKLDSFTGFFVGLVEVAGESVVDGCGCSK